MKKTLILIISIFLLISCWQEEKIEELKNHNINIKEVNLEKEDLNYYKIEDTKLKKTNTDETVAEVNDKNNLEEVLETCSSECWKDSQKYCLEEKTFLNNSNQITWTCRSFSKYNVWFPRCQWFCKQFWKNKVKCKNSDWSINKRCN